MTIASYAELFDRKTVSQILEDDAISEESVLQYLGQLSFVPCLAFEELRQELNDQKMWQLYQEIEIPTAYYLYQMERRGVCADGTVLSEMSAQLQTTVETLEQEIYDLAGEKFNINSPKQLGVILFEKMKLPFAKKTKTGYSTSADILDKLRTEDPIIPKILEYRQVTKLKSTYADGLPVYIEEDGRIHGKFNQTITATGRISSTEYSDPYGAWKTAPQGIYAERRMGISGCRLFSDRVACVSASVRRPGAYRSVSGE